jgi:hypothetical protein
MLTSAKIAKQNGDTRTCESETGYLNLSIKPILPDCEANISRLALFAQQTGVLLPPPPPAHMSLLGYICIFILVYYDRIYILSKNSKILY